MVSVTQNFRHLHDLGREIAEALLEDFFVVVSEISEEENISLSGASANSIKIPARVCTEPVCSARSTAGWGRACAAPV